MKSQFTLTSGEKDSVHILRNGKDISGPMSLYDAKKLIKRLRGTHDAARAR
jgi:hypothetical protein